MDDGFLGMKGAYRVVATTYQDGGRATALVRFSDGSLGIRRDGVVLGVWEAPDGDACLAAFAQLVGPVAADDLLVIRRASPGMPGRAGLN